MTEEFEEYDNIVAAIIAGESKSLRKIGLTKQNVDFQFNSNQIVQIKSQTGKYFLRVIKGATPLIYAILCVQLDTVLYLILHLHASLEKAVNGWYPIHYAAAIHDSDILLNILRIEGTEEEIFRTCDDGSTPLHIAAANNNLNQVLILLAEGSDVDSKNNIGNTPLHLASKGSNLLIVRALISCGSKIGVQNNTKESPLSISKLSPNDEIKQYFIDLSQKKILRDSLDELISQYMPSLNQEEEEDSDGPNRPSQYETPSLPIKVRNQAISKKGKDSLLYDSIYKELKDIDKRITKVMESSHIHQIHSREFQDQSSISTQEENDNMFKTLNRYSNTLSGKIHSLAYELDIDHNEEEETHDDKASTEKASTGKEEQPIENQPFQKPLSQFLYFSGKTHCYFCGAAQYHLCSTCKCHVCPICEFSSIHERKHH